MSTGLPDAEIKKILGIATSTLDNHKTNLFAKIRDHGFEVHSKAELAAWFRAFANDISI